MHTIKPAELRVAALTAAILLSHQGASAACGATVNGRPMSTQECALNLQVYGRVIPGDYLADNRGNWVNANNPTHRGNTYRDARSTSGGRWSGGSYVSPHGVFDASGGCEGGSCVNIVD